jgi:hypothetical protein
MTDAELRALVREEVMRHLGGVAPARAPGAAAPAQASHGMFVLTTGADADGSCVIEPAVACTHCGYCKSYGH